MEYFISTYSCDTCPYRQHNQTELCPSCGGAMTPETDPDQMMTVSVASDSELAARKIPERDEQGRVVMEETGEVRYEQVFNTQTGETDVIEIPVIEPKLRPLTAAELAELKEQRDRNLDALESVAVKQVSHRSDL